MTNTDSQSPEYGKCEQMLDYIKRNPQQIVDVEEAQVQVIIFRLADSWFGIYGSAAKEVLTAEKITSVPGSPDFIVGIISVRGDIESIIDLNCLLRLPAEQHRQKWRVIIAQSGGVRSGIRVSAIEDVIDIPVGEIRATISTLGDNIKNFAVGETLYQDKVVTLLDVGKIYAMIAVD